MQIVFLGDNLHEVSNSFFFFFYRKIRKIKFKMSSAETYLACNVITDCRRPTFRNQQTGELYFGVLFE